MKKASLLENINYNDDKPAVQLILETEFSKEIRIVFKAGQLMKEHKAPLPIVVEVFQGEIEFGVNQTVHHLIKGDLITVGASIAHDLNAITDSIVRLTLSKGDSVERVEQVN